MAQFDRFIDRSFAAPPTLARMFGALVTIAWIIKAADSGRLEDILIAVFFVVMLLPSVIGPKPGRAWLAVLERYPILNAALTFLLMTGMLFAMLAEFLGLGRPTSILIATPVGLVLTFIGALRQRARLRAG
ncbi:hypothetical protein [Kribbella sp. NPDC048928]|uniref:hypothetical protein n=1 Tax=Kribbella sp. NPDC048928 TaxID=3364111 RepID=UPI00372142CD